MADTDIKTSADSAPRPGLPFNAAAPRDLVELAYSQLEHALDARRRGLRIHESLKSLNDVIGTQYGDRVLFELIQNAHDAHGKDDKGEIAIRLIVESDVQGELLVANRGKRSLPPISMRFGTLA